VSNFVIQAAFDHTISRDKLIIVDSESLFPAICWLRIPIFIWKQKLQKNNLMVNNHMPFFGTVMDMPRTSVIRKQAIIGNFYLGNSDRIFTNLQQRRLIGYGLFLFPSGEIIYNHFFK
jgi:hypothetical protein